MHTLNTEKERNTFASLVLSGLLSNDFSFLMMEGKEALRDEFSSAIKDMKDDGTMNKLIQEQIDAPINGEEVKGSVDDFPTFSALFVMTLPYLFIDSRSLGNVLFIRSEIPRVYKLLKGVTNNENRRYILMKCKKSGSRRKQPGAGRRKS